MVAQRLVCNEDFNREFTLFERLFHIHVIFLNCVALKIQCFLSAVFLTVGLIGILDGNKERALDE